MIFDDLIFMIFGDTTGLIFPVLIQDHQKSWS